MLKHSFYSHLINIHVPVILSTNKTVYKRLQSYLALKGLKWYQNCEKSNIRDQSCENWIPRRLKINHVMYHKLYLYDCSTQWVNKSVCDPGVQSPTIMCALSASHTHDKPSQCYLNVGPSSATMAQHWTDIGSVYRVHRHNINDAVARQVLRRWATARSKLGQRRRHRPNINLTVTLGTN